MLLIENPILLAYVTFEKAQIAESFTRENILKMSPEVANYLINRMKFLEMWD
jgi:hypothetical protein